MYVQRFVFKPRPGMRGKTAEVLAKVPPSPWAGFSFRVMTPAYGAPDRDVVIGDETFESWDERHRKHDAHFKLLSESGWMSQLREAVTGWDEDLLWILREEAQPGKPADFVMRIGLYTKPGTTRRANDLMMNRPLPDLPGLTFRLLLPLTGPKAQNYLVAEWGYSSLDGYYEAQLALGETQAAKDWFAKWREVTQAGGLHVMYSIEG